MRARITPGRFWPPCGPKGHQGPLRGVGGRSSPRASTAWLLVLILMWLGTTTIWAAETKRILNLFDVSSSATDDSPVHHPTMPGNNPPLANVTVITPSAGMSETEKTTWS